MPRPYRPSRSDARRPPPARPVDTNSWARRRALRAADEAYAEQRAAAQRRTAEEARAAPAATDDQQAPQPQE